jgi:hypothetical protein
MQPAELRNIEGRSILELKQSDELNEQILTMKPNLQPITPSGPVPATCKCDPPHFIRSEGFNICNKPELLHSKLES